MSYQPRIRDANGLYLLDYTDRVFDHRTKNTHRVTGFYFIERYGSGCHRLVSCLPEDPRANVVSTYSTSGHIFRPWEISFSGFIPWEEDLILSQKDSARKMVARSTDTIDSDGYPGLFARLGVRLSAHNEVALKKWQIDTSEAIAKLLLKDSKKERGQVAPIPSALS
jgi:hypothetical protein